MNAAGLLRSARSLALPFAALAIALTALPACEEKKPDRLALDPAGPFRFDKQGQTEEVKVAAFTGVKPYVKAVPVVYSSSDTSVASVDDKGTITSIGSGKATITAAAWGLTTTADVSVTIPATVDVKDDVPHPMKMSHKGAQLTVVVKDDKGNVIDKPLISYRASDYCVEVDDSGFVKPLADGDCDVIVTVASASARLKMQVRE